MLLPLLLLLLTACSDKPIEESVLLSSARKNMTKNHYARAGKQYFSLWCNFPNQNTDYLLSAIKAYAQAGQLTKALALAEDYAILTGDELHFIKGLAYYTKVTSPLKDVDKAKKAIYHLKHCKQTEQVKLMLDYLEKAVDYQALMDVKQALEQNSLPYVLAQGQHKHYQEYFNQLQKHARDSVKVKA